MATLSTVLGSLEAYLHQCLTRMDIDSKPAKRFVKRSGKEIAANPIEAIPAGSRLYQFECENPSDVQTVYCGSSYTGRIYKFDLKVLYSNYEGWTQAALSDHSTLSNYVLTNPSSATGIQSVTIEDKPEITHYPTEQKFIMTLKVKAFLEISE